MAKIFVEGVLIVLMPYCLLLCPTLLKQDLPLFDAATRYASIGMSVKTAILFVAADRTSIHWYHPRYTSHPTKIMGRHLNLKLDTDVPACLFVTD